MSRTIDEKVVEMRFDNSNFERNVSTTMSTLDRLKQKLNLSGASKGLENIDSAARNVNMTGLGNAVESVRAKFSALEVMGVTALANITNSAVNAGKRIVSSLTIDQVTAGWNKYGEKTASVQAILNATGKSLDEVNGYLDQLMWYSDETSYGFTDMTASLGQLTSAGGKIENLIPMIEGVANATAFAGKGASEFSRAIYNLNQSYSAGYLQYMDWRSLELAGVASKQLKETLIDTAVAMGKIKEGEVTVANFSETLKDKWADTSVMEAAFGKFAEMTQAAYEAVKSGEYETASEAIDALASKYDELGVKAFRSAQEAKSFSEAIDATKDAVSTGWMRTSELIFGNYEESRKLWTDVANSFWDIFASGGESRNEMLSTAMNSKWDKLIEQIEAAGVSADAFQDKLKETAREQGVAIDDLIAEYGSLGRVISAGKLSKGVIIETIKKLAGYFDKTSSAVEVTTDKLEHFQSLVTRVIRGEFGNGADRINAMAAAGENYVAVQTLVNKVWERTGGTWSDCTITADDLASVIGDLSDSEIESMGYTKEQVEALRDLAEQAEKTGTPLNELIKSLEKPSGRELLSGTIHNVLEAFSKAIATIREGWSEIFTSDRIANGVYRFLEILNNLSSKLILSDGNADKLRRTVKGVAAAFDILLTVIGGPIKIAFNFVKEVLSALNINILDVTAYVGDAIVKFRDWIKEHDYIAEAAKRLAPYIAKLVDVVGDIINRIGEWISKNQFLSKAIERVSKFITASADAISAWVDGLKETDNVGEYIVDGLLKGIWAGIKRVGAAMWEFAQTIINTVCEVLGIHSPSRVFFEIGQNVVAGFINGLKTAVKNVWAWLENFGEKLVDRFVAIVSHIDFSMIFGVSVLGLVYYGIKKFSDIVNLIAAPLQGLRNMYTGIGNMFTGIGKFFKGAAMNQRAKAARTFATAIAILAGSIALLSQIPSESLWRSVGAIGALSGILVVFVGAMTGLGILMNKFGGGVGGSVKDTATALLMLSGSLLVIAFAMQKLSDIDPEKMPVIVESLTAAVIALGVLMAACGQLVKMDKGSAAAAGLSVMLMAASMLIMVRVIKKLSGVSDEDVMKGVAFVLAVGLLFTAITSVASLASNYSAGAGAMLLMMSVAMFIMVRTVKSAAKLNPSDAAKGLIFVSAVGALFAAIIAVSVIAGQYSSRAGAALLLMAVAMRLMVSVVHAAGSMDENELKRGTAFVVGIGALFAAIVAVSHFAGANAAKAGTMLLAMAAAIGVLSLSMLLLSNLDDQAVARGMAAIGTMLAGFAVIVAMTHKAKDISKTMLPIVISIGLLTLAVTGLSYIDHSRLAVATASLSAIMGMFAVMVAATKFANETKEMRKTLTTMTGVVIVLAGLIVVLSTIKDPSSVLPAVLGLSALMLAFSTSLIILGKAGEVARGTYKSMFAMFLTAVGLAAILTAMSKLKVNNNVIQSAIGLGIVLNAFASSLVILSQASDLAITTEQALFPLLIVSAGLGALLIILAGLETGNNAIQSAIGLGILLNAYAASIVVLSQAGDVSYSAAQAVMPMMQAAIGLGVILTLLSAFKTGNNAIQSATGLGILLNAFASSLVILSKVKEISDSAVDALAPMTFVALGLGVILTAMSKFKVGDNVIQSAIGLGILLNAFASSLVILSNAKEISDSAIGALAPMLGITLGLAVILGALSALKIDLSIKSALALGTLLNAMAAALVILQFVKAPVAEGVTSMMLLGVVVLELGVVLSLIAKMNVESCIPIAIALSTLLVAMSASLVLLEVAGALGPAVFIGIAALGTMAVMLAGIFEAFGALTTWFPKLEQFLDKGITIMDKIGHAIGSFFGNIVSGFTDSVASTLPTIGLALTQFMANVTPFIVGMKMVDDSVLTGVQSLAKSVLYLAGADFISRIPKLLKAEGSLADLGTLLSRFMRNASTFIEKAAEINPSAMRGVKTLAEAVMIFTAGDFVEAIKGKIFGNDSGGLADFSKQLVAFGEGVAAFSAAVSGNIDSDAVQAAASAGKVMAELANNLPPDPDSLIGKLTGKISMDEFGDQLVPFGRAMVRFSDVVAGNIDASAVEAASTAGSLMAELSNKLPDSPDTVMGKIKGKVPMDEFGNQLVLFGTAMVRFSNVVAGNINTEAVQNAATAGGIMNELANCLPEDPGSIKAWFTGSNISLTDFGQELMHFGEAIVSFSSIVAGNIDGAAVESAANAGSMMSELAKNLPEEKQLWKFWETDTMDFSGFATELVEFAKGMAEFSRTLTEAGINSSLISTVAEVGTQIARLDKTLPDNMDLSRITPGLDSFGQAMIDFSAKISGNVDLTAISVCSEVGRNLSLTASLMPDEVDLSRITNGLDEFGTAMVEFSTTVKDINTGTSLSTAVELGKSIKEMITNIPENVDLVSYSAGIRKLGAALVAFSSTEGIGSIDQTAVSTACAAGVQIGQMMYEIPLTINPENFINNVADVGKSLIDFSKAVAEGFDMATITEATDAGSRIAAMLKEIPNNVDPTFFIENIASVGTALGDFSNAVNGTINMGAVVIATSCGNSIAETLKNLRGIPDISEFVTNLAIFGQALIDYSNQVDGAIDSGSVSEANLVISSIGSTIKNFPESTKLTSVITNLPKFGESLESFSTSVNSINSMNISATVGRVRNALESLNTKITAFNLATLTNVTNGFADFNSTLKNLGADNVTAFTSALENAKSTVSNAGSNLVKGLSDGMLSGSSRLRTACISLVRSCTSSISNRYNDFVSLGRYVVQGFAQGITSNTYLAQSRARDMAQSAFNAAKSKLHVNSPSKVFRKLGTAVPEGFAQGIGKLGSLVKGSAVGMADTAINGTRDAIARISDIINSDVDAEPTIRPVLDLSEVKAGAGAINSMIGGTASIGVMSNINAISTMMNRSQNGSNSDVISAIKDLGRTLGNTSGNTYTINGITYDDGSNVSEAIRTLVRAAKVERRT